MNNIEIEIRDEIGLCFLNYSTEELLRIHHQKDKLYPNNSVDGYYEHWEMIERLEDRLQEEM